MQRNINIGRLLKAIETIKSDTASLFHSDIRFLSFESRLKFIDRGITELFRNKIFIRELSKLKRPPNIVRIFNEEHARLLNQLMKIGLAMKEYGDEIEQKILSKNNSVKIIQQIAEDLLTISQFRPKLKNPDAPELVFLCEIFGGLHIRSSQPNDLSCGLVLTWAEQCVELGTSQYPITSAVDEKDQARFKKERYKSWPKKQVTKIDYVNKLQLLKQDFPYFILLDNYPKEETNFAIGIRKHATHFEVYDPHFGHFFFPNALKAGSWLYMLFQHYQREGLPCEYATLFRHNSSAAKPSSFPPQQMLDDAAFSVAATLQRESGEKTETKLLGIICELGWFFSETNLNNLMVFLMRCETGQRFADDFGNLFDRAIYEKLTNTDCIHDAIVQLRKIKRARFKPHEEVNDDDEVREVLRDARSIASALAIEFQAASQKLIDARRTNASKATILTLILKRNAVKARQKKLHVSPIMRDLFSVRFDPAEARELLDSIPLGTTADANDEAEAMALLDLVNQIEYLHRGLVFLKSNLKERKYECDQLENVEQAQVSEYLLRLITEKLSQLEALRDKALTEAQLMEVQQEARALFENFDDIVARGAQLNLEAFAKMLEAILLRQIKRKYLPGEMNRLCRIYAFSTSHMRVIFRDVVNPATPKKYEVAYYEKYYFINSLIEMIESESYWKEKVSFLNAKGAPDGIIKMRQQISTLRRTGCKNPEAYFSEVAAIIGQVSQERLDLSKNCCFFPCTRAEETSMFYKIGVLATEILDDNKREELYVFKLFNKLKSDFVRHIYQSSPINSLAHSAAFPAFSP